MKIALHGYSRTGKDSVGRVLQDHYGCQRVALGDLIKRDLDPVVQARFGFSAFTEDTAQKAAIRGTLVAYGYDAYEPLFGELMDVVKASAVPLVNTRIFRAVECERWRAAGGVVWEVRRTGVGPAEPREHEELQAAYEAGLIDGVLVNDGALSDLPAKVAALLSPEL